MDLLGGDIELRSKRELIEKFIQENLPVIHDADNIPDEFEKYWQEQKILALNKLCEDEHLDKEQFKAPPPPFVAHETNHKGKRII